MLHTLRSTQTLFIGIALLMLGNGLQGTLLGVRASLEGFSTLLTGLIMTGYFVGYLVGSQIVPQLVRNVGHVRVFAALASLASVSALVHGVLVEPAVWMVMRLLTGFSFAGLFIVSESWLNATATNRSRGKLLSLYMITVYGCMAGGQLLLGLARPDDFPLFVLISVLISLALVPMALTNVATPSLITPQPVSLAALYRSSPLGVAGILINGIGNGVLFGMGAVFATQLGLDLEQTALFMMSAIVGGALLQWPIGLLSDRFDRRIVITAMGFLAAALALAAYDCSDHNNPYLPLLSGLFGGVMLALYPLSIAHTNDHLAPEQMISASAGLALLSGIGASLGPLSASLMMNAFGAGGFFGWLAFIHLLLGCFAVYRIAQSAPPPLAEQGPFVPVAARTSAVAAAIAARETVQSLEETATTADASAPTQPQLAPAVSVSLPAAEKW